MRATSVIAAMLLSLLLVGTTAAPAPGADPVGFIRNVEGAGLVQREGKDLAAREGLELVEGDVIRTGSDGRIGVLFHDDTRVGLGPGSEVRIVRYRFQPARDDLAFVLQIARGAVSYVSGKIAALGPSHVRIETPVGIVGVRGTAFAVRIGAD